MYNFDFLKNEELINVFDDVWISQGKNEKCTTIALTNQRLLFLDYDKLDPRENLRYKEVYYTINLDNIKNISYKNNILKISFKDNITPIEIDNEELYKLLKEVTSNKN